MAIGFALFWAHLVAIPISNASINPARSTAVAFFNANGAVGQLWASWVAPIGDGLIAGATYPWLTGERREHLDISGSTETVTDAERDEQARPILDD